MKELTTYSYFCKSAAGKTPTIESFSHLRHWLQIIEGLLSRGYSDEDCGKIIGGNFYSLFQRVWKNPGFWAVTIDISLKIQRGKTGHPNTERSHHQWWSSNNGTPTRCQTTDEQNNPEGPLFLTRLDPYKKSIIKPVLIPSFFHFFYRLLR